MNNPVSSRFNFTKTAFNNKISGKGSYLYTNGMCWTIPWWDGGYCIFRIFPHFNPDDPSQWDKTVLDSGDLGYALFSTRAALAIGVNEDKLSFSLWDSMNYEGDPNNTPYSVLYSYIKNMSRGEACMQEPAWTSLLQGGAGRGACLPPPKGISVAQVHLIDYRGKTKRIEKKLSDAMRYPALMQFSPNASIALVKGIMQFHESNPDWDITSPEQGAFVTMWPEMAQNPITKAHGREGAMDFNCLITKEYPIEGIQVTASWSDKVTNNEIRNAVTPWKDLIIFPTIAEQLSHVREAFPGYEDMLYAAFSEGHPEWIDEELLDEARKVTEAREKTRRRFTIPSFNSGPSVLPAAGSAAVPTTGSAVIPTTEVKVDPTSVGVDGEPTVEAGFYATPFDTDDKNKDEQSDDNNNPIRLF